MCGSETHSEIPWLWIWLCGNQDRICLLVLEIHDFEINGVVPQVAGQREILGLVPHDGDGLDGTPDSRRQLWKADVQLEKHRGCRRKEERLVGLHLSLVPLQRHQQIGGMPRPARALAAAVAPRFAQGVPRLHGRVGRDAVQVQRELRDTLGRNFQCLAAVVVFQHLEIKRKRLQIALWDLKVERGLVELEHAVDDGDNGRLPEGAAR